MSNLNSKLGANIRHCNIDIALFLDNMENEYNILLDSDIEVAMTMDEVSEYTRETCHTMKSNLELLRRLKLLSYEELQDMRDLADSIRMNKIDAVPEICK